MKKPKLQIKIKGNYKLIKNKYVYKDKLIICQREGSFVTIKENKLIIKTDVTGIDKLYVEIKNNNITVSNKFKDFIDNELNEEFLEFQNIKGYIPYPFTILKNIIKTPPGIITEFYINKNNEIKYTYRPSDELKIFDRGQKFNKREFNKKFTALLIKNAEPYPEFTSSFSGGFDSLFLTQIYKNKIKYLLHFSEDKKININNYKKIFPNKKWIIVSGEERFSEQNKKEYFKYTDEPCCDPAGFAEYLMMKKLNSQINTPPVINGQSSDAIFANGRKYFQEYFSNKLPQFMKNLSEKNTNTWLRLRLNTYSQDTSKRFEQIYLSNYKFSKTNKQEMQKIYEIYFKAIKNDSTNFLAAITMMQKYSIYELEKIKTAAQATNTKYYLPFMAKNIIQYAFSIPSARKIGFNLGKKILRKSYPEITKMKFVSRDFKPQLLKERLIGEKLTEEKYKKYYIQKWIKYNKGK
ncbi:MAG: asparagine synthase-related protein [Candidatus Nanoarchaeia archaeon]